METEYLNYLGMIAGCLTTSAFIPQLHKLWKSKSGQDISLTMFIVFNTGVLLWMLYGSIIESPPIVISNLITLILGVSIISLKLFYKNKN
jgi:MtN3 and saliva related transmembrane protein